MGHISSYKAYLKNTEKKLTEQEGASDVYNIPDKFKSESDAIDQKKNSIIQMEQTLAQEKANLNKLVKDLQNKISAERVAAQNAQKSQSATNAPTQVPPTV